MKKLNLLLLALLLCTPAFAAEVLPHASRVADAGAIDKADLHAWLTSFEGVDKLGAFEVQVPADKLQALATSTAGGGPLWIGVHGDVGFTFNPTAKARGLGSMIVADAVQVWTGSFRSAGANGVRLQIEDLGMPAGAALYVYNRDGQAYGPYTAPGRGASLWTNTVAGDEITLQAHLPMSGTRTKVGGDLFRVVSLSHLGDRYMFGGQSLDKAFCAWNDSCIRNAECESIPGSVAPLQNGVAYLLFDLPGGTYLCTGGLLNDTDNSETPYLLTANHCFNNQSAASSLEAYFQWTVPCGGSCGSQYFPPGSVPRVLGATHLQSSSTTDFTLVQLSGAAPAGSVFLGWTTAAVANSSGTNLFRVSHPHGSPQAYSEQSVNTSSGTCSSLPRGNFIYSDATLGDTEGGSSGSPVVNGSGQVVGQLYGACGSSPSTTCDGDDRTVDGAFAVTFNSIAQWLDPGSGPTCSAIGQACNANSDCCSNKCRGRRGSKTCR